MNEIVAKYLGVTEVNYVSPEKWNGYHLNPEFLTENDAVLSDVNWDGNGLGFDPEKSDRPLLICNQGDPNYKASISTSGWRVWKWTSMRSDGYVYKRGGDDSDDWKLSSADFAIFRLPEMYYIYAESDARLHGGTTSDATAVGYIRALRNRAGLTTKASLSVEDILKDKAVEYLWEGQRRQDEIRLGIFDSDKNRWIYPILESDRAANGNLEQNPGY